MLTRLDKGLLRLMRTHGHSAASERAMKLLGGAGEWGAIWIAASLGLAAAQRDKRSRWLAGASIAPAAIGINYAAKLMVRRPRPRLRGLPRLGPAPSELSFPSAHAASSLAAATAIARIAPWARLPAYVLAMGICATRPYLGLHYPSDVLAGAVLGVGLGRIWPGLADQ